MKKIFAITILFAILPVLCGGTNKRIDREQFINLLNLEKGNEFDPNGYFFSDMGNWHGYGFNNSQSLENAGGFRGPAFVGGRHTGLIWLSDNFEKLTLSEQLGTTQRKIDFTKITSYEYLPGMLRQQLEAEGLTVCLKEIAVSERTTMIEYKITNNSDRDRNVNVSVGGSVTYKNAKCDVEDKNTIYVNVANGKHHFLLSFPEESKVDAVSEKEYKAEIGSVTLRPGKSFTFHSFTTFCPASTKENALAAHRKIKTKATKKYFKDNEIRWQGYLGSILNHPTPYLQKQRYRQWAVKALMTLTTNWRSAAGDLKHGGVFPATGHFDAFWAWDSWEHAAALAVFNPRLAKEQMLTMFDYQTPEGMIVDLISIDKKENNNACSKPPIAGWATYMVYQRTGDKAFVKEMLPKLLKFHEWRYKYRDHDQNGLCEYGGTGPEVYLGQWESGMDVAVKFEGVKMLKNNEGAYSFDQESIELNSYLCAEKFYLAYLMDVVGEKEKAAQYREAGRLLRKKIQENFFDDETGFFYDRKLGSGELVKVMDISGWIPLLTQVATPTQATAVKDNMLNPEYFGSYFPFSSLNHKHPMYQPDKGYFRGQTWMNYTYFGIRGFKNYGFSEVAERYTWLLPDKLKGLAEPGMPIRENWNSATGEGMTARHFGWSSAFSIILLLEDAETFPYMPDM